jgi:hypothetical protein
MVARKKSNPQGETEHAESPAGLQDLPTNAMLEKVEWHSHSCLCHWIVSAKVELYFRQLFDWKRSVGIALRRGYALNSSKIVSDLDAGPL